MTIEVQTVVRLRDSCVAMLERRGIPYRGYLDLQEHLSTKVTFRKYTVARSYFAEQNMGLVHLLVKKHFAYAKRFGKEDLVQEGLFGILRAIDLYRLKVSTFSTYATWWIRHYIQRALENKLRTVRIPSYQLMRVEKLRRQRDLDPEDAEFLSKMLPGLNCVFPGDSVFERQSVSMDMDRLHDSTRVNEALDKLDPRSVFIIREYFIVGRSFQEIGDQIGISRERVRQLHEKALDDLRQELK